VKDFYAEVYVAYTKKWRISGLTNHGWIL